MTRRQHERFAQALLVICLLSLAAYVTVGMARAAPELNNSYSPPASSCNPPADNWATLVACKTATAAAGTALPTSSQGGATATAAPTFTTVPTLRATEVPTETPPPLLIDSDGNPWVCNQQASWTAVDSGRRWFVLDCARPPVQPTPTRIPTVTALP